MKTKKADKSQEWRPVKVYLASRNSSGIHEVVLRVNSDDRVLGDLDSHFLPWGYLSEVSTGRDWRTAHCFFAREQATADYIALEKARLRTAQDALKQIAA